MAPSGVFISWATPDVRRPRKAIFQFERVDPVHYEVLPMLAKSILAGLDLLLLLAYVVVVLLQD